MNAKRIAPTWIRKSRPLAAAVLMLAAMSASCARQVQPTQHNAPAEAGEREARFKERLEGLVQSTGGELGFAMRVIEGGKLVSIRGMESFPMASVYKFPIALAMLAEVERGKADLARFVSFGRDLSCGGPMMETLRGDPVSSTLGDLIDWMVVTSDNTACNVVLRELGGPAAATANLKRLGIQGIRVDRNELDLARDELRIAHPERVPDNASAEQLGEVENAMTPEDWRRSGDAFAKDPRDTATPEAMLELLVLFHEGKALGPGMTAWLRKRMEKAKPIRIGLGVPEGTQVLHKTGTGPQLFNDVGIVTLPDGRHLAMVIFIRRAHNATMESASRVIGAVARAAWEEYAVHGSVARWR
ncbi:MAG: class A beta-lactamase [Deltaproteobacteria bacterium]|nr:class A beta-lactamase [Deltaproteobacteria bacterium]